MFPERRLTFLLASLLSIPPVGCAPAKDAQTTLELDRLRLEIQTDKEQKNTPNDTNPQPQDKTIPEA